ncbi:MAG: V-type ATP synthase subunit F [Candidatus Thermoplasmatota archaeon]|nr:V-type ATP synthase subunit F [Candidatus Thermoplasmatota archaeon]MDI6855756.1 V-type ATP synthase subunit F [Candidatus Thermoplasmatota archaeon]
MKGANEILALGDKETILPLKAFGIVAEDCKTSEQALNIIKLRAKDFTLIFITEELAGPIQEELKILRAEKIFPIILEIPSKSGSTGLSKDKLKKIVEKAVGADILK